MNLIISLAPTSFMLGCTNDFCDGLRYPIEDCVQFDLPGAVSTNSSIWNGLKLMCIWTSYYGKNISHN